MKPTKRFIKKHILGVNNEWESHIENIFRLFDSNKIAPQPKTMLDVGCGDGTRSLSLAKYFNIERKNVYGLDYDRNLLGVCN